VTQVGVALHVLGPPSAIGFPLPAYDRQRQRLELAR
jgi:hypothetical protein